MSIQRLLLLLCIAFSLSISTLQAQQSGQDQEQEKEHKVVIIKKIVDQNGEEETIKIELEGEDAEAYIIQNDDNIEVGPLGISEDNQIIQVKVEGEKEGFNIIGTEDENVKIFIQDKSSSSFTEITEAEMEKINPESIVNVNVEKNNGTTVIGIVLKDSDEQLEEKSEKRQEAMPHGEKPFMGIHMTQEKRVENGVNILTQSKGVLISKVVEGSPAEKGGLLEDDIIISIDGKASKDVDKLIDQIKTFKIGDKVTLEILRGKENLTKEIILGAKPVRNRNLQSREHRFMRGESPRIHRVKKDPCKPIIGFYNKRSEGEGVGIRKIIADTPAERQGLRADDIVLEMDNVAIRSWEHLIELRDAHEAGDKFKLLIQRDGQTKKIKARFNECEKDEEVEIIIDEVSSEIEEEVEFNLRAFPNPSNGIISIEYKGNVAPLVLSVSDITGKEIYKKELPNFDGQLRETINLEQEGLNTAIISIQQGDNVFSEKIIIQPRS